MDFYGFNDVGNAAARFRGCRCFACCTTRSDAGVARCATGLREARFRAGGCWADDATI